VSSSAPFDRPENGLFVCGTDTEAGKTYIASAIARSLTAKGLSIGVYKPVASGCLWQEGQLVSEDATALREASACEDSLSSVCPQCFEAPLAPPVAAAKEGRNVDAELLRSGLGYWSQRCDLVIVEGAGGLLSPLSDHDSTVTLAAEFGYPIVLVAANRLGAINHVLQSLCVLEKHASDIPIAGIVLNQVDAREDASYRSNAEEIRSRSDVPLLGQVAWQSPAPLSDVDWQAVSMCDDRNA